ncbi:MAG: GAF domain-containing protein [Bradyrhizobium sp.]
MHKIEPCRDSPEGGEMRQRGRSEQPVKGRRAKRPKARKVSTAASSIADLQRQVGNLTRKLEEAREQQTATADVLKMISGSAFELSPVLQTVVSAAVRLCRADQATIYREENGEYRWAADHSLAPDYARIERNVRIRPSIGTLVGRVALNRDTVQILDAWTDPLYEVKEDARVGGVHTMLGVPLLREGLPIGVIGLARRKVEPYTEKEIALVRTFADQAVIAIDNARLFEELRQSLQQQTATADVLKVISRSAFDLKTVLDTLLRSAGRLCEADMGVIARRQEERFYRTVAYGLPVDLRSLIEDQPVELSRDSGSGRALLEGRVIQINDIEADAEYTHVSRGTGAFRTLLGVPMMREGAPVGVMTLMRKYVQPFTDKQIELVSTFADQAAIAIENVRLFDEVQMRTKELAASLQELSTAQDRLVQTEKLASLGQLTAGIAHEIKNPLNFVNNFSALSAELIEELNELLRSATLSDKLRGDVDELTGLLKDNLGKVVQHGKRADSIVKNMLLHSREGTGERRSIDINALVAESLNLAYHGARAEKAGFSITLKHDLDPEAGALELYPQEMTRALLNLISNGFYAATRRKAEADDETFEPVLSAATRNLGKTVEIRIRDNGTGIPPEVREKIFNPFFTTKPTGEGTGLGLSMTHDIIVKQHGGRIDVETEPGVFTEFIITLPRETGTVTA